MDSGLGDMSVFGYGMWGWLAGSTETADETMATGETMAGWLDSLPPVVFSSCAEVKRQGEIGDGRDTTDLIYY